jgi:undecaprenyl-diphosphatase
MEIWQAILLGAIQGFTEFLPVSSSGHLLLLQNWFGITEGAVFFSLMLHVGTLVPVIIVLWKEILSTLKRPYNKFLYWVIASIPAGIIGIIFSVVFDLDELFANNIWLLAITFLLTAGELIFAEQRAKKVELNNGINLKSSFIMGIGQACGVLPGLSRSGTTITFGTIAKVKKDENANFSFLMSIPIIVAAVALELLKGVKNGFGGIDALPLAFGMITAMVTGYVSIKFMLKIIKKANYKWFSLYLVLIAIATIITAIV